MRPKSNKNKMETFKLTIEPDKVGKLMDEWLTLGIPCDVRVENVKEDSLRVVYLYIDDKGFSTIQKMMREEPGCITMFRFAYHYA